MLKKMKWFLLILLVLLQLMVMFLFGFTDFPVSRYTYMAVWVVCAVLIIHVSDMKKAE